MVVARQVAALKSRVQRIQPNRERRRAQSPVGRAGRIGDASDPAARSGRSEACSGPGFAADRSRRRPSCSSWIADERGGFLRRRRRWRGGRDAPGPRGGRFPAGCGASAGSGSTRRCGRRAGSPSSKPTLSTTCSSSTARQSRPGLSRRAICRRRCANGSSRAWCARRSTRCPVALRGSSDGAFPAGTA